MTFSKGTADFWLMELDPMMTFEYLCVFRPDRDTHGI